MQLKPKKIWTKQGHTQQGRSGFTLLEILVALFLMKKQELLKVLLLGHVRVDLPFLLIEVKMIGVGD